MKLRNECLKVGTWNVRTLYQAGKLDNCIQEMKNNKLDMVGLAEVRWEDTGHMIKGEHTLFFLRRKAAQKWSRANCKE